MTQQDAQAVALQQADGQKQQGERGEGIAEGDQPEGRHEQTCSKNQGGAVQRVGESCARQPVHPMGPADAFQAVQPLAALDQARAQFVGRQPAKGDELRQPQRDSEKTAQPDEQDAGSEYGADARNRNGNHKNERQECRKQQQAFVADEIPNLRKGDLVRGQVANHNV